MNGCCEQAARFAEERIVRARRPGARRGLRVLIAGCGDLGTALGLELAGESGGDETGPFENLEPPMPPQAP